ncbi:protein of unknown function [Acetoanaerobium sticklandii]|uniref:Uncharacterized protein n=1 Tax=Acetoanaerobium sticklandii (strain ATCC 12662 / DSM 519 / JCM 1433 / CCUG 9281 / NCIMB 10654 / HF) TaxID=499177 RepID=E3PRB0_ACESD|nr:hypothetical protein [Acetoanaerobium sticklandii]CBH20184.1 protein of unknown function [Acetoanaerobium sticklandii]
MKEIRGYNKLEMLYPDRCMLKWKPMLLSEHGEKLLDHKLEVEKLEKDFKKSSKSQKKELL